MYRHKKQLQKYTFPAIWQNKNVTVLRDIGKSAGLEPRGLSLWFFDKKRGARLIFCILNEQTLRQQSIAFVGQIAIVFEKRQARFTVYLRKIAVQFVATAEDGVELLVAEAYQGIVVDGTAVVDMANVGP